MKTRTAFGWILAAAASLALTGCKTDGGGGGGGTRPSGGDVAGPTLYDEDGGELVRILSVDRSRVESDGVVTYTLQNVSQKNLENLLYGVEFRYEASNPQKNFDNDFALTRPLQLYLDNPTQTVTATSEQAVGRKSLGTFIKVEVEKPTPTVTGTLFMSGLLECADIEGLFDTPPQPVLKVTNVSGQNVGGLEAQCVFLDRDDNKWRETTWQALASAGPGETVTLRFDLTDIPAEGRPRSVWIRIRQASLF